MDGLLGRKAGRSNFSVLKLDSAITTVVVALKYVAHLQMWEFLELNNLFTAIISANVFLLGFLLAGVLTDYKESERLPGELSVALEAIADEVIAHRDSKSGSATRECLAYMLSLIGDLKKWFHKEERTNAIMAKVRGFNTFFSAFEGDMPPNFIVRLKQEQSVLRRTILRIDTIRDTSFVTAAYRIAQINPILLIGGLVALQLDPFSNALYFTGVITLLFVYMLALIQDLDNPFGFYEDTHEDIQLKLILDTERRLQAEVSRT